MSLFDWITRSPMFRYFEDSYARDQQSMLLGVHQAFAQKRQLGETVIVAAHFGQTFESLQKSLEHSTIEYEVISSPIGPTWIEDRVRERRGRLFITLADLLDSNRLGQAPPRRDFRLGVVMIERHPLIQHDRAVELFCRAVPCCVDLGYFLALTDPVVRSVVGGATLKILDMFGMRQNEMITSKMISSRMKKELRRKAASYVSDLRADSSEQWMAINRRESVDGG